MDQHNLQGVKGDKICFLSERLELFNKKGLYHKFFPLPFPTFFTKAKIVESACHVFSFDRLSHYPLKAKNDAKESQKLTLLTYFTIIERRVREK